MQQKKQLDTIDDELTAASNRMESSQRKEKLLLYKGRSPSALKSFR